MDASRRLLVERVAASRYIGKSARLRDLLVFLCERVLEGSAEIHEHEVGQKVFGRPLNYDTGSDNIVWVHASMLRKRLDQYFAEEGSGEPVILEIPRGNYAPVFHERPEAGRLPVMARRDLGGNGNVLIVSATGGSAFNAAAAYLADEAAMVKLGQRLPAAGGASPYFEALVRVKGRSSLPRDSVVVISRAPRG